MREDQLAAFRLALTPGLGSRSSRKLLDRLKTPEKVLEGADHDWREAGVDPKLKLAAQGKRVAECAFEVAHRCTKLGIGFVTIGSREYPAVLANIFDPPPVLYFRGRLPGATRLEKSVAIVGTRKASTHGLSFAYRLASELSDAGAVIVSGLAMGVDAEAHRAVVDRDGTGIGVLAGGLDRIYPWANRRLAENLCERGCLVSEHPPGTSPRPGSFVGRNRLISGLAQALAVVEAGEGSGALSTVEFALDQSRSVFVMPGRPGDPRVAGSLPLLRDGAHPLLSSEDIALALGLQISAAGIEPLSEVGDDGTLFGADGASFDTIMAASGLTAPRLLARLSRLEMAGRIRRGDDGLYYRN